MPGGSFIVAFGKVWDIWRFYFSHTKCCNSQNNNVLTYPKIPKVNAQLADMSKEENVELIHIRCEKKSFVFDICTILKSLKSLLYCTGYIGIISILELCHY